MTESVSVQVSDDKSQQGSTPYFNENGCDTNKLTVEGCKKILDAYKKGNQLSIFNEWVTGISYNGADSTNIIRDLLAGGATNNLFFNHKKLRRSPYAMIAMLIDEIIYRNEPAAAVLIFREFDNAQNLKDIQQFVESHRNYLSSKCYYDLQNDFDLSLPDANRKILTVHGDSSFINDKKLENCERLHVLNSHKKCPEYTTNNLYLARQRKAESESHRLSKIMLVGYGFGEGFIEMTGIKAFTFLFLGISAPGYLLIMASAFMIAAYINYSFGRDDTTKFILRWKMGNIFKRKVTEKTSDGDKISYKKFTGKEKVIVCLFAFLSLLAAFCAFVLCVASMTASYPILAASIVPLLLFVPASLIFTNMVYKYIDNNGLEGMKEYFDSRFKQNWANNKLKMIYEGFKLAFSIAISVLVCIATFMMLRGKCMAYLISKNFVQAAAQWISTAAAGITACVKALFSVSKISELLDFMGGYFTQKKNPDLNSSVQEPLNAQVTLTDDEKLVEKIFQRLKRGKQLVRGSKVCIKLGFLFEHAWAEGGLVIEGIDEKAKVELVPTVTPLKETGLVAAKTSYSFLTPANELVKRNVVASYDDPTDGVSRRLKV